MLKVKQFRYAADNFGYLVYTENSALAIDGGATEEILAFLSESHLELLLVANTHDHPDHTGGNEMLLRRTGARLVTMKELLRDGQILIDGEKVKAFHTPGHTDDSVSFYFPDILVTGDTLFNGTVGNCFSGNMKGFYNSINEIMSLPPDTIIYAGHDYVHLAMDFLRQLEPESGAADSYLKKYDPQDVFSYLRDEVMVNPYLRFDEPGMKNILRERGLPVGSTWQRWLSLMSIE